MTSPLSILSGVSIWVVSLICLPLASMLLLIPMHRVVEPLWPSTIDEYVLADGSVHLVQTDSPEHRFPRSRLRSQPLSATVLDMKQGPQRLGFVVSVLATQPAESDSSLQQPWINPSIWPTGDGPVSMPDECRIALSVPGRPIEWLDCANLIRAVQPNRLALMEQLQVALARLGDRSNAKAMPKADVQ
ncbi:MAG: hypothetical protein AAGH65_09150 [Pseudomonadota bacterium]